MTRRPTKRRNTKMMSLNEALEHIMLAKSMTRDEATKDLAEAIENKKVRARKVPIKSTVEHLSGEQAAAAFAERSEAVFMPLGYFINIFEFSPADIVVELGSGRLRARVSDHVRLSVLIGESVPADFFTLDAKAIHDWMFDPQTPPKLIAQMTKAMSDPDFGRKPQQNITVGRGHVRC